MDAEVVESVHDSIAVFLISSSEQCKIVSKEKVGNFRTSGTDGYGGLVQDVNFMICFSEKEFHAHDK